ncbi:ArsR/SmtB family transcription factor [Phenylobacterium sp. 58.2.17]|uniref:ArsR/SmtB family transcription factor n=1 Tax=Phenylobacterium sp. 58.2.17 TaxID=2969306 RepID=UPI002264D9C4|nr:metalloregulator ArsR/SmtB family transcription factor [Phenylobacterium sp. 58.2.17]MCX7587326.1 metalloregulator ArsR/SmtB family transcription factor [Phenylobacterium sp. 58.2.17]
MTLSTSQAVEILRAAGEPTRLRILALLSTEELAVLELCRVLDQSQPRVSRHLKLLAEAGLVERFPDGAWVFYRLVTSGDARHLADQALGLIDPTDEVVVRDAERLQAVRGERSAEAGEYFARNAARWDEIRSLYVSESAVEAAIIDAVGPGPFKRLVDLGSGTGRMLTLLGPHAEAAIGLDLSQQMLNIARNHVAEAGLEGFELRHGDIFGTRLPGQSADLVVVHQVLHYLADPASAVREAARLVAEGGRLLIIDFAPHHLEFLREQHQHRRLGFAEPEMARWLEDAGLSDVRVTALPPARAEGLTVKIWVAERARLPQRSAA